MSQYSDNCDFSTLNQMGDNVFHLMARKGDLAGFRGEIDKARKCGMSADELWKHLTTKNIFSCTPLDVAVSNAKNAASDKAADYQSLIRMLQEKGNIYTKNATASASAYVSDVSDRVKQESSDIWNQTKDFSRQVENRLSNSSDNLRKNLASTTRAVEKESANVLQRVGNFFSSWFVPNQEGGSAETWGSEYDYNDGVMMGGDWTAKAGSYHMTPHQLAQYGGDWDDDFSGDVTNGWDDDYGRQDNYSEDTSDDDEDVGEFHLSPEMSRVKTEADGVMDEIKTLLMDKEGISEREAAIVRGYLRREVVESNPSKFDGKENDLAKAKEMLKIVKSASKYKDFIKRHVSVDMMVEGATKYRENNPRPVTPKKPKSSRKTKSEERELSRFFAESLNGVYGDVNSPNMSFLDSPQLNDRDW